MNDKTPDAQLARHDKAKDYQGEAWEIAKKAANQILRGFDESAASTHIEVEMLKIIPLASLLEARDQLGELKVEIAGEKLLRVALREEFNKSLTAEKQAHRECHAGMVTELEKVNGELAKIKARNVINAIKRICEVCGHENNEDGCAFCISEKLTALRQSSGALYNWIQGNVTIDERTRDVMNKLFDELDKGVKEGKR